MGRLHYIGRRLLRHGLALLGLMLVLELYGGALAAGRPVFTEGMLEKAVFVLRSPSFTYDTYTKPEKVYTLTDPDLIRLARDFCLTIERNVGGNHDGKWFSSYMGGSPNQLEVTVGASTHIIIFSGDHTKDGHMLTAVMRLESDRFLWNRACIVDSEPYSVLQAALYKHYPTSRY